MNRIDVAPVFSALLLVLAWLVPIHYYPWTSFYNEMAASLSLLVILGYCAWRYRGDKAVMPTFAGFLFFLALIPLVQALFGKVVFAGDGILASLYLGGAAIAYVLGNRIARDDFVLCFTGVLLAFLAGAVISAFIALYQWLGLSIANLNFWVSDHATGARAYANLNQPNNLATLLCLGLVACLYFYSKRFFGQLTFWLLVFVLSVGLAAAASRTSWVILGFLVLWWATIIRPGNEIVKLADIVGIIALFAALLLTVFPLVSDWLLLSGPPRALAIDGSGRFEIWLLLFAALWEMPAWGYGWGQISTAQVLAAEPSMPQAHMTEYSHNVALDLLLWNGWLLGGVIIAVFAYWGISRTLAAKVTEVRYALLAVAVVVIHGMLEYPLAYAYFLFPVAFLMGAVDSLRGRSSIRVSPIFMPFLFVFSASLTIFVWIEYRQVEEDHRLMRFETARIGTQVQPGAYPDVLILSQLREFIRFARTEAKVGMDDDRIAWMEKVAHRYPYPPALFRYTLALALNGRIEEANTELARMSVICPEELYSEALANLRLMSRTYPDLLKLSAMQ